MKKGGYKMRTRLRVRPKFTIKKIMIYGACSVVLLVSLPFLFNLTNSRISKANTIEIIQAEDQIFISDMSIPSPVIMHQKKSGPNTVFIHKIKISQDISSEKHEK